MPTRDPFLSNINQCLQLKQHGYASRARKALESSGMADLHDPQVREASRALFPPASNATLPALPVSAPRVALEMDDLSKTVKACDNGSAAGISGWSSAHLRILIDDPDCAAGLLVLCTDICNGHLDRRAKPYLLASRYVAPLKPNGDIRPVCINEPLYKVCATYLNGLNKKPIADVLLPVNFGCGVKGGVDFAATCTTALLTDPENPDCGMKEDAQNAFNSIERKTVLQRLYDEESLSSMWRLANWSYNEPSPVFVMVGWRDPRRNAVFSRR